VPNRVIRGEINSSRSLALVSRDARLTFRALLNVVDDFGRFDGRIPLLRSLLFPIDPDVTDEMVAGWLRELTVERPVPPVSFYTVDGLEYLHLPRFEKHRGNSRRALASRLPDPPDDLVSPDPPDPPDPREKFAGGGVGGGGGDGGGDGGVAPAARPITKQAEAITDPPQKPPKRPPRSPEAWSLRLSRILQELLADAPGARFPAGCENRWAREIERMPKEVPELRALAPEDCEKRIEFAIRWALGPDNLGREFEVVIRSGKALREKWSKLVAGAQRTGRQGVQTEAFQKFIDNGDEVAPK
jgi:hypothetical protein